MNDTGTFQYRLAMVGPTAVGKTSLIVSILREAQTLLAGTGVSIEAGDDQTQKRINLLKQELTASLMAGEFNHEEIKGTQSAFKYLLDMKVLRDRTKLRLDFLDTKLRLGFLDYPGTWIDSEKPKESVVATEWEKCKEWMEESAVLIVPIDATLVMESKTTSDRLDALRTLEIELTAKVVRSWAKSKILNKEPGLLILAPVKCESYFNDNGGIKDRSEELFEKVNQFYLELIESVHEELAGAKQNSDSSDKSIPIDVSIQYHPVDTIGSVELKKTRWIKNKYDKQGKRSFEAEYLVRDAGRLKPRGADGILIAICQHILAQEKDKSLGIPARFWRWVTRENQKLLTVIKKLGDKPAASNRKKII